MSKILRTPDLSLDGPDYVNRNWKFCRSTIQRIFEINYVNMQLVFFPDYTSGSDCKLAAFVSDGGRNFKLQKLPTDVVIDGHLYTFYPDTSRAFRKLGIKPGDFYWVRCYEC